MSAAEIEIRTSMLAEVVDEFERAGRATELERLADQHAVRAGLDELFCDPGVGHNDDLGSGGSNGRWW